MKRSLFLGVVIIAAALQLSAAGSWTALGPVAGSVSSLALDPSSSSTLYAGTVNGGLFKSTDGGSSWAVVGPTLPRTSIGALAINPAEPRTLFAGTYEKGVFRSNDAGATWKQVLFRDNMAQITAMAIDPKQPNTIWAATETGPQDGVWKSVDGGATWQRNTAGLPAPAASRPSSWKGRHTRSSQAYPRRPRILVSTAHEMVE